MRNFYIVRDERDLLSGKIIPQKVLNHIPVGALGPIIRPIPIRKSSELVIPVGGPQLNVLSPVFSPLANPVSISRTIAPLSPGCGSSVVPVSGCSGNPVLPFSGPPIIKLSPMINAGVNGIVKIISQNSVYTINVPPRLMRSVVNDIYLNSQVDLDPLETKITFRIITPTIDSSVQTTPSRMLKIVQMINNKYTGLTYFDVDGRSQSLEILLNLLANYYRRKKLIL
ncbi:hypothetical protein Indivirus_2_99 [Indivirus ILV1]|uniref:Uncharacterized protein n=1 Tax=Indivirus ILV1 TaxID=1977633 RepID=A0A1V0SDC1_9VIRU|nr:hypothetical protein Indivirus_2_99 [Indivirus ILV1]